MNGTSKAFPIALSCGLISTVKLQTDGKASFEYARIERGNNEVVIRLRLKCPGHADGMPDKVDERTKGYRK